MTMTAATEIDHLRRALDDSFKNRALLYWTIYQEMRQELGAEQAEAILSRAIYARGKQVAEAAFSQFGAQDARALGEAFLAISPDGGRLFPTEVEQLESGIAFQVKRCPLKEAWQQAKLSDADLTTICRIAGRFDNGLFETSGVTVKTETWRPGINGCCRIQLTNSQA
jgi:hypothetical protein